MKKSMVTTFLLVVFCQSILFAKTDPNNNAKSQIELDSQLKKAIKDLDPNAIKAALKAGANPNLTLFNNNFSALQAAAWENEKKEEICLVVLDMLFNAGAKIQHCDKIILCFPIAQNCPKIVEYLIQKGVSPTNKMEGMLPIEWAAHYGSNEVYNVLIEHGAKPLSKKKKSLYHFIKLAARADTKDIAKMDMLLEDGFSINGEDSRGAGAITAAAGEFWYDADRYLIVNYLIKKGVDINRSHKVSGVNQTALHAAVYGTHVALNSDELKVYCKETLKALIRAGAHVSAKDQYQREPLHIAAKYNNVFAAQILLEAGAKVMSKDSEGKTPLDYAESAEMIKLLKSHGAKEL
jgi:ankyrin repeat protein